MHKFEERFLSGVLFPETAKQLLAKGQFLTDLAPSAKASFSLPRETHIRSAIRTLCTQVIQLYRELNTWTCIISSSETSDEVQRQVKKPLQNRL